MNFWERKRQRQQKQLGWLLDSIGGECVEQDRQRRRAVACGSQPHRPTTLLFQAATAILTGGLQFFETSSPQHEACGRGSGKGSL